MNRWSNGIEVQLLVTSTVTSNQVLFNLPITDWTIKRIRGNDYCAFRHRLDELRPLIARALRESSAYAIALPRCQD